MRIISSNDVKQLAAEAAAVERQRRHLLLHADHSDQVQRLVVALTSDSYIQPHCHPEQWELIVPLQGSLTVVLFDEEGTIVARRLLEVPSVAEIPQGQWHTLVASNPICVIMEAKPGPFRPAVFAAWAPPENHHGWAEYRDRITSARTGEKLAI